MKDTLPKIEGTSLDHLPLEIMWIGDLLYWDFPLMSVYSSIDGKTYIKSWADCTTDHTHERYMIFEVSKELLYEYITYKQPYLEFYNQASEFYTVDIVYTINTNFRNIVLTDLWGIEQYLPHEKSFFDFAEDTDVDLVKEYLEKLN